MDFQQQAIINYARSPVPDYVIFEPNREALEIHPSDNSGQYQLTTTIINTMGDRIQKQIQKHYYGKAEEKQSSVD
jgi:hypothetical protein